MSCSEKYINAKCFGSIMKEELVKFIAVASTADSKVSGDGGALLPYNTERYGWVRNTSISLLAVKQYTFPMTSLRYRFISEEIAFEVDDELVAAEEGPALTSFVGKLNS
jgi:hypothetical protein